MFFKNVENLNLQKRLINIKAEWQRKRGSLNLQRKKRIFYKLDNNLRLIFCPEI